MRIAYRILGGFAFVSLLSASLNAQTRHELGLTLGAISAPSRTLQGAAGTISTDTGVALQANYGYRLLGGNKAALYGEVHFLANPLREIATSNQNVTRDYATLYVTPGIRVKFAPRSAFSPYAVAGGGYALYEQSFFTVSGADNPAPRFIHRGAFTFGGGFDVKGWWNWLGFRAEIRDFYSGNPALNFSPTSGGQHNVVVGGGLVVKWGDNE